MALKRRTKKEQIYKQLQLEVLRIENDLIRIMTQVGLKFLKDAREGVNIGDAFPKGDYTDRTANLRSSIGFFVLRDGHVLHSETSGNLEGIENAIRALNKVPKIDIQLIGVAGMDYASYVESKGYNVITSQGEAAVIDLEKLWRRYANRNKLSERFNL